MRKLLSLLFTVFAVSIYADTQTLSVNYKAWMSQLSDETRITDLSIPFAHDAATWTASLSSKEDQEYDEKTLFDKGVRGFDFRVSDYDGYHMMHGNANNILCKLGKMDEEVNDHMPDNSSIGNEFLIFDIQAEGSFDGTDEEKKLARHKATTHFVKLVVDKYGKERFVYLRPNMLLGELRGKIAIVAQDNNLSEDILREILEDETYVVPINRFSVVSGDCNRAASVEAKFVGDASLTEESNTTPVVFQNVFEGDGELKKAEEYPDTKFKCVKTAYENYLNRLQTQGNADGVLHVSNLNGYNRDNAWYGAIIQKQAEYLPLIYRFANLIVVPKGGYVVSNDDGNTYGVNHLSSDYFGTKLSPLGIIKFDFCGKSGNACGDMLLNTIVNHNFAGIMMSDIKVFAGAEENEQQIIARMVAEGYTRVGDDTNRGAGGDIVYVGAKYTRNANNAINDIVLFHSENTDASHTTITIDGDEYTRVPAWRYGSNSFDGDLCSGIDDDHHYYLHVKKTGKATDNVAIRLKCTAGFFNFTPNGGVVKTYQYKDSSIKVYDSNHHDLNKGLGGDYVYITADSHAHRELTLAYNDSTHFKSCAECSYVDSTTVKRHNIQYDVYDGDRNLGVHRAYCFGDATAEGYYAGDNACAFSRLERCTVGGVDEATGKNLCYYCEDYVNSYDLSATTVTDHKDLYILPDDLTLDLQASDSTLVYGTDYLINFETDDVEETSRYYGKACFKGILTFTPMGNNTGTKTVELIMQQALEEVDADNGRLANYYDYTTDLYMYRPLENYADQYQTLALPFSLTKDQVAESLASPTAGIVPQLRHITNVTVDSEGYLNITTQLSDSITAGEPYLISWPDGDGQDSWEPCFHDVIVEDTVNCVTSFADVDVYSVYYKTAVTGGDKNTLFLGSCNKIYWPSQDGCISGYRIFFRNKTASQVKGMRLDGSEQATGIASMAPDQQGQTNLAGAKSALKLIVNGHPVIISGGKIFSVDGKRVSK